eukprot:6972274-Lingulodinium_polyedra.AAC.1
MRIASECRRIFCIHSERECRVCIRHLVCVFCGARAWQPPVAAPAVRPGRRTTSVPSNVR